MNLLIRLTASFLCALTVLSLFPVSGEHRIYEDVLRLHVLAVSDEPEDQAVKLAVRDAVLECVRGRIADCTSFAEADAAAAGMLAEIRSAAERAVREHGGTYGVDVSLTEEAYPRRDYGSVSLPAGTYRSLKVTLGDGAGKNWWCVLFPTVCVRFAEDSGEEEYLAAGFTPEEYRIITGSGTWKVKFRILEILSELFGR